MTELEVAALAASDPRSIAGYALRGRLGEGGMGVVYLADRPDRPGADANSRAALKVIRSDIASDPEFVRRFEREVQSTQAVRSDAVAAFIDSGVDDGTPWMAIAYHPGLTLKDWIQANGPLDRDQVEVLARGLLRGLADIHRVGLVHRDLKPSNVLLTSDGPILIDFGVALATEGTSITRTGHAVGSPGWMAPEQVTGGDIGQAVDIFGWASVVQFAATGDSPFGKGRPEAQLYRVRHADPAPHDIEGVLGQMVTAALAKDAVERPDARTIAAALDRGQLFELDRAESDAPFTRLDLPVDVVVAPLDTSRSPLLIAALITLLVAVATALLIANVGSGVTEIGAQTQLGATGTEATSSVASSTAQAETDGSNGSEPALVVGDAAAECATGRGAARTPDVRSVPERAARSLFGSIWPGALLAVPFDEVARDSVTLGDGRVATITFTDDLVVWDPADPLAELVRWEPLPSTTWVLTAVADSHVAVGSDDGTVAIFDASEPSQPGVVFDTHDGRIISVLELCDGRVAVTGASSSDVAVIDPERGVVERWSGDSAFATAGLSAMTRLSDERIAVAGLAGEVLIFDGAGEVDTPVDSIVTGLSGGIVGIDALDDGLIVVVDTTGQAEAWRLGAEAPVAARLIGPKDWLGATVAPLSDGRLAIGDRSGAAQVWHPQTDRIVELDAGQVDTDVPLVVNDENREIATTVAGDVVAVSLDGVMRIWPTGLSAEDMPVIVAPAAVVMLDPDALASGHEIAALGEGRIAAIGSAMRIIDVQASIASSANPLSDIVAVAASDELIAVARVDGRVSVLDGNELVVDVPGEGRVVTALAVDAETVVVAVAGASPGQDAAVISRISAGGGDTIEHPVGSDVTVIHVFDDGSGALALGFADGTVSRLDDDGLVSPIFDGAESAVTALAQLDDGRLVVGADDSAFWVVDAVSGEVVEVEHPYGSPAPLTVWDQRIVTAGGSGRFRLWDPRSIDADPLVVETGRHAIVGFTQFGERLVVANAIGELRAYEPGGSLVAQRDLSRSLVAIAGTGSGGLEQVVVAGESGASAIDLASEGE